jgi:GNAT superfamily N-acetyltransferase
MAPRRGIELRVADLRSGWRTDFFLHRVGAEVIEQEDCIVVRSPGNEGFYWGNCLMVADTPRDGDLAHWLERFEQQVAVGRPGVRHVAIGFNSEPPPDDGLPSWRAAGFELMETVTLRLRRGCLREHQPATAAPLRFGALDWSREINTFVDLQCADSQGHEPDAYRRFRREQMQRFASLHAQGWGDWFGLWCEGVLVADCGLLRDGALGRFQNVLVHPDWRRRGLCRELVSRVCEWGFGPWGLDELLMCADPEDVAVDIYESLGFERFEREWGLQRHPPEDEGARRSVRLGKPVE